MSSELPERERRRPAVGALLASVKLLVRLLKALERLIYGSRIRESWRFPAGSLRTARQALGLEVDQTYNLVFPGSLGTLEHKANWYWMDASKKPLHTELDTIAVLVATGTALHARVAGSDRGMADLILFGPTPLSPYPRTLPLLPQSLDPTDRRRLGQAIQMLTTAARITAGHDDTVAAHQRVTDALHELDRWHHGL